MNPADANSSLATLRQLKEMLDAGTLTPQEFEALKQKLVFGKESTSANTEMPAAEAGPAIPTPPAEATLAPPVPLRVELPTALDAPDSADWLAVSAPMMLENTLANEAAQEAETPEERRSSLTIIFIVGGILLLLAAVLYLTLGSKTPDEHLTSTSQTAADSTTTKPEIGPQANQLVLPPATPETVRVAPAVPIAPPVATAAAKFSTDSVAAPAAVATPVPAKVVAPKPTPATTATADTAI